jgi:hypothetical protein
MAKHPHIRIVHDVPSGIVEQNAIIKQVVTKSVEMLEAPLPDTFLGRKTQEPFPREDKQGCSS